MSQTWIRNLSEHRCRPTPPTWPDVNTHSRALKTDPKHTTRQWSIIISSRPPPRTRENAGRCAAASFSGGAIKSGLFDSRKSRDKMETRTISVFGAPTNQFELWLRSLLRAGRLRADKFGEKSASLMSDKRMPLNAIWSNKSYLIFHKRISPTRGGRFIQAEISWTAIRSKST